MKSRQKNCNNNLQKKKAVKEISVSCTSSLRKNLNRPVKIRQKLTHIPIESNFRPIEEFEH